jgi:hypothetical protein
MDRLFHSDPDGFDNLFQFGHLFSAPRAMPSEKSTSTPTVTKKKDKHRIQRGYEVCVHTCIPGGCINPTTKTILWRNEGHACRRHACNSKAHISCGNEGDENTADCPGYKFLGQSGHPKDGTREPTEDELTLVNDMPVLVYPTRVIKEEELDGDAFKYPAQASTVRPFNIVFIPDPSLESNKELALADLAFVQTTVSVNEWKSMEHLKGSIHHILNLKTDKNRKRPEHKVCMQEWVSLYIIFDRSATMLTYSCYHQLFLVTILSRWTHPANKDKSFKVEYMQWNTFFAALMDPENHGSVLSMMGNADCIIGGVDYSTSYM